MKTRDSDLKFQIFKQNKSEQQRKYLESIVPNMPASNIIMPRDTQEIPNPCTRFFVNKLVDEYVNPTENHMSSMIFDFRYMRELETPWATYKAIAEFSRLISSNNLSSYPFKLKFYNYSRDSDFHQTFPNSDQFFTNNFIELFSHNYLENIPKKKLVYLTKDASEPMVKYDPSKIYIVGAILKQMKNQTFATLSTANKEGITTMRLPIRENME